VSYASRGDVNSDRYEYIAFVLPAYTYQVPICVIMLISDYSSLHDFTELVHMDIFCMHVLKRI
jgi:hypothetical protein